MRGFTLLETVITVTLFTFFLGAIAAAAHTFYTARTTAVEQAFALQYARTGISSVVRDVREAAYADSGQYPIDTIDPYELVFFADTDRDNSVEKIRYFLQGSELQKGVIDATGNPPTYTGSESISVIARDVRNSDRGEPVFTYYTRGSATSTTDVVTDVGYITVSLTINVTPWRQPNDYSLSSSAALRNVTLPSQ